MNKKTKALAAGVAGVAVLAASGATFALWTDSAYLGEDLLRTGQLRLADGDLAWTDISPIIVDRESGELVENDLTYPTVWSPAADLLVPGDVVEATITNADTIVAYAGRNLVWELTFPGLEAIAAENPDIEDFDVAEFLTIDPVKADGNIVGFTVAFDASGIDAQLVNAVSLAGAEIVVTQVREIR